MSEEINDSNINENVMDNQDLKKAIKLLLADMLEDEVDLKNKPLSDMYAQGQLSATQYNRVKIEKILESLGSRRTSTIDVQNCFERKASECVLFDETDKYIDKE